MTDDIITKIAQILIALSSLVVSVVALRLSRKVTLKKNLKEKQFELMCKLIEDISKEMLLIHCKYKNGDSSTSFIAFPQLRLKNFRQTHSYLFDSNTFLYFDSSITGNYNFIKARWNALMPKSIVNELNIFGQGIEKKITESSLKNLKSYVMIDFCAEEYQTNFYPKGKEFESFESFVIFANHFFDKIDQWLESHGAEDLKFKR